MAVNVLLNYYNFDEPWARPHLEKLLVGKKVLILPLAFRQIQAWDNDSFLSVYGKGGEKYDNIIKPFLAYGIEESSIAWLNPFDDSQSYAAMVKQADVLFFTGGMPEKAIRRLIQMGIAEEVKKHPFVMGASAGAMLQLEKYHVTPDEDYPSYSLWRGLGLVKGFGLEVHYLATDIQQQCTARAVKDYNYPVYQMWHQGGLLIVDGSITIMGQVEVVK